jgi:hypothetical protein
MGHTRGEGRGERACQRSAAPGAPPVAERDTGMKFDQHERAGRRCVSVIEDDVVQQLVSGKTAVLGRCSAADVARTAAPARQYEFSGGKRSRFRRRVGMYGSGEGHMQRALLGVIILAYSCCEVRGAAFNPTFMWMPQELHSCAVPSELSPTTCKCYIFDPNNAVQPCTSTKPPIADADFVTNPIPVPNPHPVVKCQYGCAGCQGSNRGASFSAQISVSAWSRSFGSLS